MQLVSLHKEIDLLQKKFGDDGLTAVYGTGKTKNPKALFVFMNPTAKNISTSPNWKGLRAPWLGTKNTWKLFAQIGIFSKKVHDEIQQRKSSEWDNDFCHNVYKEVVKNNFFISNLAKCTKNTAINPSNKVFKEYRELMLKEIDLLTPKIIIAFGNQVSSVLIGKSINVSRSRKMSYDLEINTKTYKVFPVFYPVGQGMRNIGSSIEDIKYILETYSKNLR